MRYFDDGEQTTMPAEGEEQVAEETTPKETAPEGTTGDDDQSAA